MGVLDKLINRTRNNGGNSYHKTTKGFCIGIPEAEAEATTASIKLDTFFVDYLDVLKQLNNEKFIVLGRKGTGKSAIGEHILSLAKNEANMFCDFIKKEDIDIEKIVQIGKIEGIRIERGLLYKWIVLTKFVVLFAENQSLTCIKGMKYLSDFIKKSRGFINIKNYEVKEVIQQYGLSVSIEYFKRYLSASGNNNKQYKYEKAEFYKLIPDLEKVVIDILKADKDNQYILMFDDLDIGLNLNNQESIDTLTELIRTIKYYN
ncbi:P-loop ATPase, Sll1717 family, partial [Hoylesella saccharolytica]